MLKTSLVVCLVLVLTCGVMMPGFADKADLSMIREQNGLYVVTDMDDIMTAVTSPLSQYASFPLPSWGENSRALAYFTIFSFDYGEASITQPSLLISVYTDRPRNINSLTIPVDGKDFTFSWQPSLGDYSVTENGYCQNIRIMFGQGNTAFIEAMNEKCTSVMDPNLLYSMPVEIVFHGDEDCEATMSEYTMMDYTIVVYAGYCVTLDGMNQYIHTNPGTAMTESNAVSVPNGIKDTDEADENTVSEEAMPQPMLLQDLVGVWELESVEYSGTVVTGEVFNTVNGDPFTAEFTSDGLLILAGADHAEVYEFPVVDGVLFPNDDSSQAFRLENSKLILEVTDFPGVTMTLVRSELQGREATAAVDDAILGTWVFERVVHRGEDLPDDIPLEADMFPIVYGIPAPTLQVRKAGLVMMSLGDETVTFTSEEWQLEDEKLTHTETFDDGTSMIWYFVRETSAEDIQDSTGTDLNAGGESNK